MRYLARREHSRAELHRKLLPYLQEGDDLEAVLNHLEQRNWLSDARAASQLVHRKRDRFGGQRIIHELRQRGIAENLIEGELAQLKESELESARKVWQKKFGEPPANQKEKIRQARFLKSRGFSMDVIFKVISGMGDGDGFE